MENNMNIETFDDFCRLLFADVEKRLNSIRSNASFWSVGNSSVLQSFIIKETIPELGSWYAESKLPEVGDDEYGGISVAVTPGEVRVGLILPSSYVSPDFYSTGIRNEEIMAKAFNGHRCDKSMRLSDTHWLFDHFFNTDPFSAQWMFEAHTDSRKFQSVSVRLSYIILTCWKSALQAIVDNMMSNRSHENEFIVLSKNLFSFHDLNSRAENGHFYRIKKTSFDRANGHQYRICSNGRLDDLKKILEHLAPDASASTFDADFLF